MRRNKAMRGHGDRRSELGGTCRQRVKKEEDRIRFESLGVARFDRSMDGRLTDEDSSVGEADLRRVLPIQPFGGGPPAEQGQRQALLERGRYFRELGRQPRVRGAVRRAVPELRFRVGAVVGVVVR